MKIRKKCTACGKRTRKFHRDASHKDGFKTHCKECRNNEMSLRYYLNQK